MTTSTSACGRSSSIRWSARSRTGASPTAASGRCGASPSTSRRRRSCAGSPPTGVLVWPASARSPSWPSAWQAAADEIHADVCANGTNGNGVFTQHYDTDALDASLLLIPLMGFLPADDPRVRATVMAIADELSDDDLVLRYRVEGDRRRSLGRGGHVHHLLVLARVRTGRDRGGRAAPASCARSCSTSPASSGSTPRRSNPAADATSATSRRRSPTWRSSTPSCA